MPDQYSINHKDKYSNDDFINCEFDLAETVKMRKDGKWKSISFLIKMRKNTISMNIHV